MCSLENRVDWDSVSTKLINVALKETCSLITEFEVDELDAWLLLTVSESLTDSNSN